ncbi:hypothetical protein [Streptomyces hydrogenans]|uniref:hypothetical protein n=1 Tax=Streptomyces hydrogenans TaxID=1873719 RepID=UPI0035D9E580
MSDNPFRTYLPRTPKESVAFMLVIAVISVNTIPVVIGGLTSGFTLSAPATVGVGGDDPDPATVP